VLISCAAVPDGLVVEIAEDGPGIPAGERERVFGRFVQLDASREHASGSAGLGLAIAREIATTHGATVVLTEARGRGTRAVVTLGGVASGRRNHGPFGINRSFDQTAGGSLPRGPGYGLRPACRASEFQEPGHAKAG